MYNVWYNSFRTKVIKAHLYIVSMCAVPSEQKIFPSFRKETNTIAYRRNRNRKRTIFDSSLSISVKWDSRGGFKRRLESWLSIIFQQIISRSKGQSAIASAAYRSGDRLTR